ncbi:PHP domain containing protein [uncultured Caudovirales phage]|uniref:DNA-directed DNA polymerase n=1 Tax=uncultured Caudovirales phage TaxID=2100421 RepID=A0A6J5RK59_9CAUD|nr:PHP domain containing protein [uncultured Caudovirales phage]
MLCVWQKNEHEKTQCTSSKRSPRNIGKEKKMSNYWSAHTHSRFSAKDALPTVEAIVNKAEHFGYPALGLTDHGNMGGAVQLYKACRKAGIEPLPGIEAYVSLNRNEARPSTMHMGLLATTQDGYRNLVSLVTQSHQQFKYKPILDLADFAQAAEDGRLDGIAAMTGCWFGLLPTMLRTPDENIATMTSNVLLSLASWFGSGLYVEIQNHVIHDDTHDDDLHSQVLLGIAKKHGLPIVITQDSHYVEPEDRALHETMKRLVSWSDDPDDAVFPGDGYHMVDDEWMIDHHTPEIYAAGIEGLNDLLSKAQVVIPELDTFKLKVPDTTISGDPNNELDKLTRIALDLKIKNGKIKESNKDEYYRRLENELKVVIDADFAGYLLFTASVTEYMDQKQINYNVRGSASGSLLCWLLHITSFDPVTWGLLAERFLSPGQVAPPDIDIDIEHDRRQEMMEWLQEHAHTANIGTWLSMGLDSEGEQKGSLMIRYKMHARKTGKDPDLPVPPKEWAQLQALAEKKALLGYGVHAAGLLVTPDEYTAGVVPMQYVASSKTMVTMFGKEDVEALGLVKLDLLGLKTLTALRIIRKYSDVQIEDIPLNDKKVFQAMSKGNTSGLFQLEGGSGRSGVRRLKPTKIADVIAAMALFRPATMESGATDDFINRRQGITKAPERHKIIADETKETYGVLLYQEQVISVLRSVGLDAQEIEKARKAIKASNADVGNARGELTKLFMRIEKLAKEKGMSATDIDWLKEALNAYASYGFNKAHATAYGVLAYITGYYSVHHPVAFWAGMLDAYTGAQQEASYLTAAREAGVVIRSAHVNTASIGYTADMETQTIRKGLTSIHGVGSKAAEELVRHAPYASLDDLARKVSARRVSGAKALGMGHSPESCGGIIAALNTANALFGLEREAK